MVESLNIVLSGQLSPKCPCHLCSLNPCKDAHHRVESERWYSASDIPLGRFWPEANYLITVG